MTLSELATQAPGLGLGREQSTWASLGEECWITVLGRRFKDRAALIASVIYHEPSETVLALELTGPPNVLWVDEDYREQFIEEIQSRGMQPPEVTLDWVTQLALLGERSQRLLSMGDDDEPGTAVPETDQ